MSVKIKTKDQFKYGQKNVVPYLGTVQIDENGVVEVSTLELAKKIVDCNIGFSLVEGTETTTTTTQIPVTTTTQAPTTTTTEVPVTTTTTEIVVTTTQVVEEIVKKTEDENLGGTSEDANDIGNSNVKMSKEEQLRSEFELLNVPDLQAMANPFPKKDWQSLKKADLINYLVNKLAPEVTEEQ